MKTLLLTVLALAITGAAYAAEFTWTGMRNPCKLSAEDGLNEKQLAKKIGTFLTLADKDAWAQAIFNVQNRFPNSKPWVTWSVGEVKDAESLTDDVNEACLTHLDQLGVVVFLELAPNKKADVPAQIDTWLAKFKHHPSVQGLSVDLEFFKRADDATAQAWDEKIKSFNPKYRLMLKHWEINFMPPNYRGKGDLVFTDTSSEAPMDELNKGFAAWADHFAPSAVAFQIGYPADEDALDGKNTTGWWKLPDPIKAWGDDLLSRINNPKQELGLLWVCAKSGKSYNTAWDLTKGAKVPGAAK